MDTQPFVGEIGLIAGTFAPRGWALCNGSLLPLSQNTALYSLLGTTYGGNGTSNFALPDLRGRVPVGQGEGPGSQVYDLGRTGGSDAVTLEASQIPAHTHQLRAAAGTADRAVAAGSLLAASTAGAPYGPAGPGSVQLRVLGSTGGGQPHENRQPYLTLTYCIALQGVFPPRP